MPLTLKSSRATDTPRLLSPSMSAVTAFGELLLDHAAHGEHLVAHALQVFVEAARDVVRKIGGFHGNLRLRATRAAKFVSDR